jgi:hypothetical protein
MTDDSTRSIALADELIEATRAKHRAPGAIFYSDALHALNSVAGALHRKGVPTDTVVRILRDSAVSLEHDLLLEFGGHPDHQVTVEPGPKKGDAAREALAEQLRRMERWVQLRQDDHRLSQACETLRAELAALDQGGAIDRAEAMVRLAGMLSDYAHDAELPF